MNLENSSAPRLSTCQRIKKRNVSSIPTKSLRKEIRLRSPQLDNRLSLSSRGDIRENFRNIRLMEPSLRITLHRKLRIYLAAVERTLVTQGATSQTPTTQC